MQQRGPKTNNVGLLYLVCLRSVADGLCVLKYRYTLLGWTLDKPNGFLVHLPSRVQSLGGNLVKSVVNIYTFI